MAREFWWQLRHDRKYACVVLAFLIYVAAFALGLLWNLAAQLPPAGVAPGGIALMRPLVPFFQLAAMIPVPVRRAGRAARAVALHAGPSCLESMMIEDQPPPVPGDGQSIHDLVMRDVADRKALGLARYGTLLQAHNGRDALTDLYQELLDAACYIRQVIEERAGPGTGNTP